MIDINVIRTAIEKYEDKIKEKPKEDMNKLSKSLDITTSELCTFQNAKSIAQAEGFIDYETALLAYNALGDWPNTRLSVKIVLTQLFAVLIARRIKA